MTRRLSCAAVRALAGLVLLLVGCSPPASSLRAADAPDWCGTYVFDGAAGRTAGGSPIAYHYTLSVRRPGAAPGCTLQLVGFQQDESLRCSSAGDPHALKVAFVSYAGGSLTNAYGVQVYRPGDVLFTLDRARHDGQPALRTTWHALHPDGLAETGLFFRQQTRCNHVP